MSQQTSAHKRSTVSSNVRNVAENWTLYDTTLIGPGLTSLAFNDGWLASYNALGLQAEVPFFNVRNKNVGLPYNNQDTRDALAWGFRIFTVGVRFFAPAVSVYSLDSPIQGDQHLPQNLFETEIAKHCQLTLQTNQDERLKTHALLTPPGYGPVGGGYSQGDVVTVSNTPNVMTQTQGQGVSILTNKWGFANPLEVPRRANLSVTLKFNDYCKNLLQAMPGPNLTPLRAVAGGDTWYACPAIAGIQVVLGGQRLVQQRGQYHA